ncbi:mitochondrial import inner membrane translocase subunit tim54, partial [Rhizoclosmatium hyalinum]
MIARGLLQSSLRRRTPTTLLPTRRWSSTLNESTTSGAPATEEKKKSYKDWIPSRGWQIFWGLTSGLITIAVYDSRRLESIQNDFIERARVQFAQQPSGILERPRKVIVCVSAGDNGKAWFESYVKP